MENLSLQLQETPSQQFVWFPKGDVTRDNPQQRLFAQHSVATLLRLILRIVPTLFQYGNAVLRLKSSLRIVCTVQHYLKSLPSLDCLLVFFLFFSFVNEKK